VDAVGVERLQLGGDPDAGDVDAGGPRVAGDLSGQVAGEVVAVGGVTGDAHVEVFEVEEPELVVLAQADGDQERVGRGLVGDVGSDLVGGDVSGDPPVVAVVAARPWGGQFGRLAEVDHDVGGGEFDGRQLRHR
jgi:hypothetical protein